MNTIHLEKKIDATVSRCFSAFRSLKTLHRWYDSRAQMSGFRVGAEVHASYFPGYRIAVVIPNHLLVQEYTTVIDGIGVWSFVTRGEASRIVFDHLASGNRGKEFHARMFHWQGLMENLAAVCESRTIPFVEGAYVGRLPRGVRFATCDQHVRAVATRSRAAQGQGV